MSRYKVNDLSHLPEFDVILDEKNPGVISLVSVVDSPAIKVKGCKLKENTPKEFKLAVMEEQQRIVGPVLIPNIPIYRNDEDGEYVMKFSAEVIRQLKENFNRSGNNHKINIDHSDEMLDAFIDNQWIVEDNIDRDQVKRKFGIDVPVGTWMWDVKVDDKDQWNMVVKELEMFGFSIEANLGLKPSHLSSQELSIEQELDLLTDDEIIQIHQELQEELIIKMLSAPDFGYDKSRYELATDVKKFAKERSGKDGEYFYYTGPNDDKTRDFCKSILKLEKVFSLENIVQLSDKTGYNVFEYIPGPVMPYGGPGGPNCRHTWTRFTGRILDPPPTSNQISKIGSESIFK